MGLGSAAFHELRRRGEPDIGGWLVGKVFSLLRQRDGGQRERKREEEGEREDERERNCLFLLWLGWL